MACLRFTQRKIVMQMTMGTFMLRISRISVFTIFLLALGACSAQNDQAAKKAHETKASSGGCGLRKHAQTDLDAARTSCEIRPEDLWPESKIRQLVQKAEQGNVAAADQLYGYYVMVEDDSPNTRRWRQKLLDLRDPGTMDDESVIKKIQADDLPDISPEKLRLLKEGVDLNTYATNHMPPIKDNDFSERLIAEYKRVKRIQNNP
jgi:hypothetical protein